MIAAPPRRLEDLAAALPEEEDVADEVTSGEWRREALEALLVGLTGHPTNPERTEGLMLRPGPYDPDTRH